MPVTPRRIQRLYTYLITAVVLIAALTVAVIALVFSNRTGNCVNDVLGERAVATQIEASARLRASDADVAYLRGKSFEGKPMTRERLASIKAANSAAQREAATYRKQHPAGRC